MSKRYELTCRLDRDQLPDILEQVELINLIGVKEPRVYVNPGAKGKHRVKTLKFRGKHKGLLTGEEIIRKIMADGRVHTATEITKAFLTDGFGRNSSSPRISAMVKRGELTMLGDGNYQAPKKKS